MFAGMKEGKRERGGGGVGGGGDVASDRENVRLARSDGEEEAESGDTSSGMTEGQKDGGKDGVKTRRRERSTCPGKEAAAEDDGDRPLSGRTTSSLADEVERMSRRKKELVMKGKEPSVWKQSIQEQIEQELERRVRDALETPPLERMRRNRHRARLREQEIRRRAQEKRSLSLQECDSHAQALPSLRDKYPWNDPSSMPASANLDNSADGHTWFEHELYGKHLREYRDSTGSDSSAGCCLDLNANQRGFRNREAGDAARSRKSRPRSRSSGITVTRDVVDKYGNAAAAESPGARDSDSEEERTIAGIRRKLFHRFTSAGFRETVGKGKTKLRRIGKGKYADKNGVILTRDGPFWPPECGPLYPKPDHSHRVPASAEPLYDNVPQDGRTIHTQRTKWYRPWEGSQTVFDSERTSKGTVPHTVAEGCCPSLVFESRFESGNLRQARRVGQFEYDLVLKTDLYTSRHTQWYYFRVQKMLPGITYKLNIINLLKKDSLYNHGMRPLLYSEKEAESSGVGWVRTGHHISYTRSYGFNRNGLLNPELTYYVLEWQMEFQHEDDTCFLAHCYPFTFTDLCQHLDELMAQPERRKTMRRDVLCESRAGNSCFLLTVSNFNDPAPKKGIVVTARVHPGETNASWMMKGLLDFITSSDPVAKDLRKSFVFKIVPMLNPDGVIVGNYRCSLAGRDLNRNYRHPKKESFPTVWNTKQMLADFSQECEEILVYCDMHGHSRKHNVFIYGCDPESQEVDMADFLCQRLFPWLLSQKAPDKFSFRGCKFRVKRCKEATGRVVMWRQMGITNSFTLEATFCGSKNITGDAPRHFNLQDFQDLGRHFCEALLVYQRAQENTSLHSELILELTREITHLILHSRGLLPPDIPLTHQSLSDSKSKKHGHKEGNRSQQTTPTGGNQQQTTPTDGNKEWGAGLDKRMRSKLAALRVIDSMSCETIQGCIELLADLHIRREFAESDTSDSDSASESEIQQGGKDDDKNSKKRRKKKGKGRTKDQGLTEADGEDRPRKKPLRPTARPQPLKKYPPFVNRYTNRTNHGIPMFSQERIEERAKLRMAATKGGEQVTGAGEEVTIDQVAHDGEYAKLIALSREMHRQNEEVRYKLMNPATCEGALQPQTISNMKIRHSYTHGNSLMQGHPPFLADLDRLQSGDDQGNQGAPPRTPPRKLDPVRGLSKSSRKGGLDKRAAFASYSLGFHGNKVGSGMLDDGVDGLVGAADSGYVIADGLLVGAGGEEGKAEQAGKGGKRNVGESGHRDSLVQSDKSESNINLSAHRAPNGEDVGGTFVFNAGNCKPNSSSFVSTSSWASTSKAKQNMRELGEATKFHSAGGGHDNRRREGKKGLGRESTMELIQRQYGRFLSGVNVGSKVTASSTSKYLDSIAKSVNGGDKASPARDKGGGTATLSRSAGLVPEKRVAAQNRTGGDRAAIFKLSESKKKNNTTS